MRDADLIAENSLMDLARAGSVRNLRVIEAGDGSWALVAAIGMTERTLKTARRNVRTWRHLDTVYRYARDRIGINRIQVEGV